MMLPASHDTSLYTGKVLQPLVVEDGLLQDFQDRLHNRLALILEQFALMRDVCNLVDTYV